MRRTISCFPACAEALGLAWAVGIALYTAVLFVLALSGAPFLALEIPSLALALAAGILAGRLLYVKRKPEIHPTDAAGAYATAGGLCLVCLSVAFSAWQALRSPLDYGSDAWAIWAFKAKIFQHGALNSGYFHSPLTFFTQPDFPLNFSIAEAVVIRLAGSHGVDGAALLGPACLAALLFLFYAGISRLYGQFVGALIAATLAALPHMSSQAAIGYADVPLAMYAGGAALYLLLWWHRRQRLDLFVMGLLAGGAIWTKKEGLVIAAALLAVATVYELLLREVRQSERWQNLGLAVAGTGAISLPWIICLLVTRPITKGGDLLPLTFANFVGHAYRIPSIAGSFARQMLAIHNWELLWVVLAGALVFRNRHLPRSSCALLVVLLIQLCAYFQAGLFSTWGALYTLARRFLFGSRLPAGCSASVIDRGRCSLYTGRVRSTSGACRERS